MYRTFHFYFSGKQYFVKLSLTTMIKEPRGQTTHQHRNLTSMTHV